MFKITYINKLEEIECLEVTTVDWEGLDAMYDNDTAGLIEIVECIVLPCPDLVSASIQQTA